MYVCMYPIKYIIHVLALCERKNPDGTTWCAHTGAVYEYKDCDGDGVLILAINVYYYNVLFVCIKP